LNEASGDDRALSLRATADARRKLDEVRLMMKNIAHELDGSRFWRYAHNITGGLQEYIEALSFFYYVEGGGLVSYEQVQANLSDDAGQPVRSRIANTA
jgi:predicted translin family RNA/ssDNA-binding protein